MKYSRERELDDEGGDEREEGREEEGPRIARPLVTNWSVMIMAMMRMIMIMRMVVMEMEMGGGTQDCKASC